MKLGDSIHAIALPVARAIDYVFGTDLENCPSCRERRTFLNKQTIWQVIKLGYSKLLQKVSNLKK